ncbi:MAG: hypothetical protein DCC71_14565 [Proteobacteria bacterium]|nr:MAG: hypothetical protein DCC71_14565 [Pseudomonadota bacterium]
MGARMLRSLLALAPVIAGVALAAGASRAAVLPFESTLAFLVAVGSPYEQHGFFVEGTGSGVATVNGSGGGPALAALAVASHAVEATGIYPYSDPQAFPVYGVAIDASNAAGSFSGAPFGGVMELRGTAKICLFDTGNCVTPAANLSVPLSLVGRPGTHVLSSGVLPLTVVGAPWTTGTAGTGFLTVMGERRGPASAAGSTAQPGGFVGLVTPTYIYTSTSSDHPMVMLTRFTVEFVPEPGTLALVGAGLAAVALRGRRRGAQIRRNVSG